MLLSRMGVVDEGRGRFVWSCVGLLVCWFVYVGINMDMDMDMELTSF